MVHQMLGNCMFQSLTQFFESPTKQHEVQSLLVQFEAKNSSFFSSLLKPSDMNSHIDAMARDLGYKH